MGSKRSRTAEANSSVNSDNFRLIKGVNAAVESRLHKAGILTFAQFASMSPEDIITLIVNLPGVTVDRVIRQNWISQARELALSPKPDESTEDGTPPDSPDSGEHFATFTTEMLLDGGNNLIHTRVRHVQTGDEELWDGWREDQFVTFIKEHAGLRPTEILAKQEEGETASAASPAAIESESMSKLRSVKLEIMAAGSDLPSMLLRGDQPFNVRVSLDLSDIAAESEGPLAYTAVVHARSLSDKRRQSFARTSGKVTLSESTVIRLSGISLGPGSYRVGADVTIHQPHLHIQTDTSLLRVY